MRCAKDDKDNCSLVILLFLLPWVDEGTKEMHTFPVNGKISLTFIFSIHSPETFLWHFKPNLKVFQLPWVAKYLSTQGTLGSSKKTTDLDQGMAWKSQTLWGCGLSGKCRIFYFWPRSRGEEGRRACGQKAPQVCGEKNTLSCDQIRTPTEGKRRELQEKECEAHMSLSWKW